LKNITLLCDSQCELGEGPLWVPQEQCIYWVDIINKTLHRIHLDGSGHRQWIFDSEISSIHQRSKGGFIATFREGFAFVDLPSGNVTPIVSPEASFDGNRYNDAKTDDRGNLWAGTMDDGEHFKSGALYKLHPNLSWQSLDEGYCITNGPAFSQCGRYVYHTDTAKRVIYRLNVNDDDTILSKEIFITLPEKDGFPDGMTVDERGDLWVCHFSGAKVSKFSAQGQCLEQYHMPVSNITSCTFVGDNLNKIVFTTARAGLSKEKLLTEPSAGGLYIADVNSKGINVTPFSG